MASVIQPTRRASKRHKQGEGERERGREEERERNNNSKRDVKQRI